MTTKFRDEDGFTYYAAGYGPRYGDFTTVYVSLVQGKAEEAAEKGAEWEAAELPSYCDNEDEKCDCQLCQPDLVIGMETSHKAKDLFSARELMEYRRELLAGNVVALSH